MRLCRKPLSVLVGLGIAAVLLTHVPDASADCRRVCRAGEVRNVQRCCVKKIVHSPRVPRHNHALLCRTRKSMASCVYEGLRLSRLKRFDRVAAPLSVACASPSTPARLRERACFTLATLVNNDRVKLGTTKPKSWQINRLMSRVCSKLRAADACRDNDGDGIHNLLDKCPAAKEDIDGYKDGDGCPDSDNDSDNVADNKDSCPHLWGESKLGCPRLGRRIGSVFLFNKHSTQLDMSTAVNRDRLSALVHTLKRNPKLTNLEVRGHSSKGEASGRVTQLAWQRARGIRNALVAAGISAKRLRSYGYGVIIYDNKLADVVVGGPVRTRLTKLQLAQGTKELRRKAGQCRKRRGNDGTAVFKFWIRADGTVLPKKMIVSGTAAGTYRSNCVRTLIFGYRFPPSRTHLTPGIVTMKF